MRNVVFVCRDPSGESLRCARAVGMLDDVRLLGICEGPPGPDDFDDFVLVGDVHNAAKLIEAVHMLRGVDRIVTAQETLLEPVAIASESLGLPGLSVAAVRRALDKTLLKKTLRDAGIRTARDYELGAVEFPLVVKPPHGSGGLATWCIRNREQLDFALQLMPPPFVAEELLEGRELCVDSITIDNEPRFHSICCYRPTILEALENPQTQWSCVMPRELGAYTGAIEAGLRAVRALQVGNAMTHMEGIVLADGNIAFTDATLRPAGARIGPMLAFAYDIDPYFVWARAAVDGAFDGPWERKYAVGTIFLRGHGSGTIAQVDGIESLGDLVVEARLPQIGATKSATYTGDGFVTVRHPETAVVEETLDTIAREVRITYSDSEPVAAPAEHWRQRLDYKQLYKPSWEGNRDSRST